MKLLKYSEILAHNRELGKTVKGKPYRIAIFSNIVVNQLGEILEFVLRSGGINAEVIYGDYDNIVQDSMRIKDIDAAIVFWEAANLIDGLSARSESMEAEELEALGSKTMREIELVLSNLSDIPLVLFNRYSAMLFAQDELKDGALQQLCNRLNVVLERTVSPHQLLVSIDKIVAQIGLFSAADFRQFQSSRSLYTVEFLKSYSAHIEPAFRAATGRVRKVLVLDCDNTLWGGVLGEDGENNIQMNDSTRNGRVFHEVQMLLKGYRKQGVLLALCSKNNPEDVNQILSEHPDMLLRESDWINKKVNWQDKASNLRQMSDELNLGLDSFVFVDDSSFELGLVQDELPQVTCVKVPETLSEYPSVIRQLTREFFTLSHTEEDDQRTELYKHEQIRNETKSRFTSIEDYLKSLGLVIEVAWDDSVSVARAAQLSQKTNQFNLTTHRYTEADIERMLADGNFIVTTFSVSDRYGDYGITGLTIIQIEQDDSAAKVDSFLMSCRTIGRNVERAFFDVLIDKLTSTGLKKLKAEYLRSAKNDQVSRFYDSLGFSETATDAGGQEYELELANYRASGINYIEVK